MGPTWGPSGADRRRVGPMLAPWTLLSWTILPPRRWKLIRQKRCKCRYGFSITMFDMIRGQSLRLYNYDCITMGGSEFQKFKPKLLSCFWYFVFVNQSSNTVITSDWNMSYDQFWIYTLVNILDDLFICYITDIIDQQVANGCQCPYQE